MQGERMSKDDMHTRSIRSVDFLLLDKEFGGLGCMVRVIAVAVF